LLATVLGGIVLLLAARLVIAERRRAEAEHDRARDPETIRDLAAQLKDAGRHLRRLSALERAAEVRRESVGLLEAVVTRIRQR
jgi:hypothetical protein